jgi:hypothetical protein
VTTPTIVTGLSPTLTIDPTAATCPLNARRQKSLLTTATAAAPGIVSAWLMGRPRPVASLSTSKYRPDTREILTRSTSSPTRIGATSESSSAATLSKAGTSAAIERKSGYDVSPYGPLLKSLVKIAITRPGAPTPGAGRNSRLSTNPNTAVLAPVPSASVSTAIDVHPGVRVSVLMA